MNADVMHIIDMKFKSLISDNNCSFIFKILTDFNCSGINFVCDSKSIIFAIRDLISKSFENIFSNDILDMKKKSQMNILNLL